MSWYTGSTQIHWIGNSRSWTSKLECIGVCVCLCVSVVLTNYFLFSSLLGTRSDCICGPLVVGWGCGTSSRPWLWVEGPSQSGSAPGWSIEWPDWDSLHLSFPSGTVITPLGFLSDPNEQSILSTCSGHGAWVRSNLCHYKPQRWETCLLVQHNIAKSNLDHPQRILTQPARCWPGRPLRTLG